MSDKRDKINEEGVPKYIQIAKVLREQIVNNEFRIDEPIPTETQLCTMFNVSRVTVRQAIQKLVQEHLLYRAQGRGTFITASKMQRDITRIYSFTADMLKLGLVPESTVVEFSVREAEEDLAEILELSSSDRRVFKLVRLRKANSTPILFETTYIPHYLCPTLIEIDFSTTSLYRTLIDTFGLVPHHAKETYEAVIMDEEIARLLQCRRPKNQPALSIRRLTMLQNNSVMEYTMSFGRGDRTTLTIDMSADLLDFQRKIDY